MSGEDLKGDIIMESTNSKDTNNQVEGICELTAMEKNEFTVTTTTNEHGDLLEGETTSPGDAQRQLQSKDDSSQKKRKNDFKDSNRSAKKLTKDEFDVRLLINSKDAGAVIGKKGCNITTLRRHFDCSVVITDCPGPERVLSFTVHSSLVEQILRSIVFYVQYGSAEEHGQESIFELRLLLHTNYVGSIIGRSGTKLKEIRQKHNTSIKIYPQCAPQSSERICIVQGKSDDVISCIKTILDIVFSHQLTGKVFYYNPVNYIADLALEYGGYLPDQSSIMNNKLRGGRDFRNYAHNTSHQQHNQSYNNYYNQQSNSMHHHYNQYNNRDQQASRQHQTGSRKYNHSKSNFSQHQHPSSSYYNSNSANNTAWSTQTSNQMNYQTSMMSPLNNYQQQSSYQNSYQQQSQSGYQSSQSNMQTSYYVDSSFSANNNSSSGKQDMQMSSIEQSNQMNHLNNNSLNSTQLSQVWSGCYNRPTGRKARDNNNITILPSVDTNANSR